MMKLAMLQRFAARGILRSTTATLIVARPLSGLADRAAAIERELRQKHYKAAHASDGSRGDWDKPKSKEEMEQLHNLYHKIDDLETELAALKAEVAEERRIFAVEAPDGTSDARLQEEMEEVKHIIADAAVLEDQEAVEKMHKKEEDVKKFHGTYVCFYSYVMFWWVENYDKFFRRKLLFLSIKISMETAV